MLRVAQRVLPRGLPSAARTRTFSSTRTAHDEQLAGTVISHNAYILLHTRSSPAAYPSRVPSRLQRVLQRAAGRAGGIVNFAWAPDLPVLDPWLRNEDEMLNEWDDEKERYRATVFCDGRKLEIEEVWMGNVDEVVRRIEDLGSSPTSTTGVHRNTEPVYAYVCTHGARDCRCGETGTAVFDALRAEVKRRNADDRVKVAAVGHVGGHKYAANVLIYPHGEWLGHLTPAVVPEVLDAVLAMQSPEFNKTFDNTSSPPLLPKFWRGRMGLGKEEQLKLIEKSTTHNIPGAETGAGAELRPHASRR